MNPEPVNFADTGGTQPRPRVRTHFGLLLLLFVLSLILFGFSYVATTGASIARITNRPFLQQLSHLLTSRDKQIQGEAEDRVNILLLGIGGAGHDGAYLTDTIIVASLKPSTKQIALLSIPRDLAVPILNQGVRKINAANSVGRDLKYPGGGEQLTSEIVSNLTGLPIHYFARVDFKGFAKLINDVGGVEITVDQNFTDREYPTTNYGYQTIGFKAGTQRLNGDTALKYVRSRHGNNGEGSDFARARRQQKVLSALKDKVFSLSTITSPRRLSLVIQTFGDHTRTNLEIWEILRLAKLTRGSSGSLISRVLDSSPTGLLKNETGFDGAFLLAPRSGTWSEVQTLAKNIFTLDAIGREEPTIAIDHAQVDRKAADVLSQRLAVYNAKVIRLPATTTPVGALTVVYDLTNGRKPFTRQALAGDYELRTIASPAELLTNGSGVPVSVSNQLTKEPVDFLILLGQTTTASSSRLRSSPPRS